MERSASLLDIHIDLTVRVVSAYLSNNYLPVAHHSAKRAAEAVHRGLGRSIGKGASRAHKHQAEHVTAALRSSRA